MSLLPDRALTKGQQAVRTFIREFHGRHDRLPSRREIGRGLARPDGGYISRVVQKLRTRGELPR